MRVFIAALALLTAGCAAKVDGTEMGGVATWRGPNPGEAVSAANAHCQRYGRVARATQIDATGYLTFSCEKGGS